MNERSARIALACVTRPQDAAVAAAIKEQGVIAVAEQRAKNFDVDSIMAATQRAGARIVMPGDLEWPTQLNDLDDEAPLALWVVGDADLRLLAVRSIAVVGARASTSYGETVCRRWCGEFEEAGFSVVSGGAYGIDAAAHRGILDAGGVTACVLACGVDVAYPRAHEGLLARIADGGVLISEAPPGTQVRRHAFLSRNRIIPALTRATLVVEAAARSGTMSTARHAESIGRPVLAVPGPVSAVMSHGCLDLIAAGTARVARDAADVLAAATGKSAEHSAPTRDLDALDQVQRVVLEELPRRSRVSPSQIALRAGLPIPVVLAALGALRSRGWAECDSSGGWRVSRLDAATKLQR